MISRDKGRRISSILVPTSRSYPGTSNDGGCFLNNIKLCWVASNAVQVDQPALSLCLGARKSEASSFDLIN
jgi:hypothetical protein